MNKPWVLPCLLLVVLLTAWYFRWDHEATKSYNTGVFKWKTDRWTGQVWAERYQGYVADERPTKPYVSKTPETDRDNLTGIWFLSVMITSIWLFFAIKIIPCLAERRKRKNFIANEKSG